MAGKKGNEVSAMADSQGEVYPMGYRRGEKVSTRVGSREEESGEKPGRYTSALEEIRHELRELWGGPPYERGDKLPATLSREECRQLMTAYLEGKQAFRNNLISRILYATGLRGEELESLKVCDKQYGHFKDRVILAAHKEINEKTDVSFDFKEIKLGRKVNELEFFMSRKTPPAPSDKAAIQKERKLQECEDRKKAQHREKVEHYLARLSADEMRALKEEAEGQARHYGGMAFRERGISEPMINAYVHTIVTKRLNIEEGRR